MGPPSHVHSTLCRTWQSDCDFHCHCQRKSVSLFCCLRCHWGIFKPVESLSQHSWTVCFFSLLHSSSLWQVFLQLFFSSLAASHLQNSSTNLSDATFFPVYHARSEAAALKAETGSYRRNRKNPEVFFSGSKLMPDERVVFLFTQ